MLCKMIVKVLNSPGTVSSLHLCKLHVVYLCDWYPITGAGTGDTGARLLSHDMTWPYFCVATCAGRGPRVWSAPWAPCDNTRLPGPGVRYVPHHEDLGPGVQEGEQHPVYTWPRSVPSPSLTIHREATPCQLFGKCQSRWISSYLSTVSPEIPERTMQPRRQETEISH